MKYIDKTQLISGPEIKNIILLEVDAMAQLTVYFDEETREKLDNAAPAEGVSRSSWLARLVREKTEEKKWPEDFDEMFDGLDDFPEVNMIRSSVGEEVPREAL